MGNQATAKEQRLSPKILNRRTASKVCAVRELTVSCQIASCTDVNVEAVGNDADLI